MLNQTVTDFTLPATNGQTFTLAAHRGKRIVLFFYPKDSTPGCTLEVQGFRDLLADFEAAGAVVLGISRDSLKSHENFKLKQSLNYELLSDSEEILCQQFAVIKQKKMYGKDVRGIERSTFLIDAEGVLRQEWRGVKVEGHVQTVLAATQNL
jgi:peroxiredoxin Q/BCP